MSTLAIVQILNLTSNGWSRIQTSVLTTQYNHIYLSTASRKLSKCRPFVKLLVCYKCNILTGLRKILLYTAMIFKHFGVSENVFNRICFAIWHGTITISVISRKYYVASEKHWVEPKIIFYVRTVKESI